MRRAERWIGFKRVDRFNGIGLLPNRSFWIESRPSYGPAQAKHLRVLMPKVNEKEPQGGAEGERTDSRVTHFRLVEGRPLLFHQELAQKFALGRH